MYTTSVCVRDGLGTRLGGTCHAVGVVWMSSGPGSMQIEGVAYRGRVMVELEMNLGSFPTDKQESIKEADKKMILVS